MSSAIVICSRLHSSRVPGKCLIKYNGVTQIEHLIARLLPSDLPIYIAVPESDVSHYMFLMDKFSKRVFITAGYPENPMKRMQAIAKQDNIKNIVRVTHDKIFVNGSLIKTFLEYFDSKNIDYLYSSDFIPGTGFEIISQNSLNLACEKFNKNIEHISYAIKAVTNKTYNYPLNNTDHKDIRLLIDYTEDVQLMDVLFSTLGTSCTLEQVIDFIKDNEWVKQINRLPLVTVYTCAYNAEKWINEAMGSVAIQDNFKNYEYIIIDDYSTDKTLYHVSKFCNTFKNSRFYKNVQNIGLAASSNRALKLARGKYIIRLDADDYFTNKNSIRDLVKEIENKNLDAVYPNCYLGISRKTIQKGNENHHTGGTIYRTSALNHLKFTDSLRNYEGLDLYVRAKDQLKIGYLNKPTFVYRQTPKSMSKTNLKERAKIKKQILKELR